MRVWISGGAGFVGSAVVRSLRRRDDRVIAAVRDRSRTPSDFSGLGIELVADDLSAVAAMSDEMRGSDAVIHAAGSYRIGIAKSERGAMWDANVGTTTRVLDAANAAGVPRIVYVSTANVFGNTRGRVVDEAYRRDLSEGFLSWYDETKYRAHELAEQRIAAGAPIVIVVPSQVYGSGDHSGFGEQLRQANAGRLRYRTVDDVGVGLVHVDDLAAGIVAAMDRGVVGQSYVLSGPLTRLRDAIEIAARVGGHTPPRLVIPTGVLRALAPLGLLIGQPNLREVISSSAGVTYWASHDRATRELGFVPREIEQGLRDTFAAA